MKKILLSAALILSCLFAKTANAQVQVNLNIGAQPDWGPVGYERADYYYIPDMDSYYDVPARQYVYYNNNGWIHSTNLPPAYSNYNIYNGYKVVVNKPKPWTNHNFYKTKYVGYKGRKQVIIRDKKVKNVTNIKVKGNNGHGHGKGKGHGKH